MVLLLDGNSEIGAHLSSNFCNVICLRNLLRSRAVTAALKKFMKRIYLFNVCAPIPEVPSNISTMPYIYSGRPVRRWVGRSSSWTRRSSRWTNGWGRWTRWCQRYCLSRSLSCIKLLYKIGLLGHTIILHIFMIGYYERLCDSKFSYKCNNNTALVKQISLFDTALVMTNT